MHHADEGRRLDTRRGTLVRVDVTDQDHDQAAGDDQQACNLHHHRNCGRGWSWKSASHESLRNRGPRRAEIFYNLLHDLLSAVGSVATLAEVPCERRTAQPTAAEFSIREPGQIVVERCGLEVVGTGPNPRR